MYLSVYEGKGKWKEEKNLEMSWEASCFFFLLGVQSGFPEHKLERVTQKQETTNAASVSGATVC